jgi:hypothetical protein
MVNHVGRPAMFEGAVDRRYLDAEIVDYGMNFLAGQRLAWGNR